ncbi:hypothetical protein [Natronomonas marina]|uniref:Nmad3 family putative nucleotide modification protein n=1 Tax=Natronomonas marina TaxID=2961939 RepID=UPI0020C9C4A3|nr:hypothetical protein [Natronomonas marina]
MRSVAINVGANTNEPGFRGPIHGDGRFEYVPIPESEPTREDAAVPTYGDLDLTIDASSVADRPVHLDPTFAGVHGCDRYTYGDPHGVKARPLLELSAGDHVFFYATLSTVGDTPADWIAPEWGAYVIGQFRLARDPLTPEAYRNLPADERAIFETNAHRKRATFDAEVLLYGDDADSGLYERAVPLSSRSAGVDANRLVTELSSDSGKGPWWRRPMTFDRDGTEELLAIRESDDRERAVE